MRYLLLLLCLAAPSLVHGRNSLTGNWLAETQRTDGSHERTYFDLKQENDHITGHIGSPRGYFNIIESAGGPAAFTLTAAPAGEPHPWKAVYEGKLAGDQLHISARRRPDATPVELTARRVAAGQGALPARIPPPALHPVSLDGLAQTPPMGWNSWNKFASRVDDAAVRAAADAIASNGMKEAGYLYVNIDDTWESDRDAAGNIQSNRKFPDMKALTAYVHSRGLKIGLYSSPGPFTCAGYEGSYGHEEQDARTYAAWGFDYLKYDWCGAREIYKDEDMQAVYQKMGDALRSAGRPIVFSLCQYGRADVWKWGPQVAGNLWRTTGDIGDNWASMSKIGFSQADLASYAAPGHWNDPDMLEIGNGGMSNTEYQTHMTLWSILAAPLLAGNDLEHMSPDVLAMLTNKEVVAVDQDSIGKQGRRVSQSGEQEVWTKDLSGGAKAVALFNRGTAAAKVSVVWSSLGFSAAPSEARDLWMHRPVKLDSPEFAAEVPSHGVVLLRVSQ